LSQPVGKFGRRAVSTLPMRLLIIGSAVAISRGEAGFGALFICPGAARKSPARRDGEVAAARRALAALE
jgi:hypothetical protein